MAQGEVSVDCSMGDRAFAGTWSPNPEQVDAAWVLLVELVTRVPINSLDDDEGSDREALASVYEIFGQSRHILRSGGASLAETGSGDVCFAGLVGAMMNGLLRPFLATWHSALTDFEVEQQHGETVGQPWSEHPEFRRCLAALGDSLNPFVEALADACGARSFVDQATE